MRFERTRTRIGGLAFLMTLGLSGGCEDALRDQFRTAAADGLQTGFSAILNGVVDGLIAIFEPDEDTGTGGTGGTDGAVGGTDGTGGAGGV